MRIAASGVLGLVLGLAASPGFATENLVANPGFEKPEKPHLSYTEPYTWIFYVIVMDTKFEYDKAVKKSGDYSYRISNGKSARGFAHSKPFTVKPNTKYRLRVWAKADNAPDKGVLARVFWFVDKPGVPSAVRQYDDTVAKGGTFDWTELKFPKDVVTSPKDATCAYIRLESNDGGKDLAYKTDGPFTVWFDQVSFIQVE